MTNNKYNKTKLLKPKRKIMNNSLSKYDVVKAELYKHFINPETFINDSNLEKSFWCWYSNKFYHTLKEFFNLPELFIDKTNLPYISIIIDDIKLNITWRFTENEWIQFSQKEPGIQKMLDYFTSISNLIQDLNQKEN